MVALARLNHRMHNKVWIADGLLAIGGGRNIGDEYFDAGAEVNFRDLDVLAAGKAVAQASTEFEHYWSSALVVPIEEFEPAPIDSGLAVLREALENTLASPQAGPYLERLRASPMIVPLVAGQRSLLAVDTLQIVSDPPEKARGRRGADLLDAIAIAIAIGEAKREVLLISPYFVPGDGGSQLLIELLRRGVKVSVLTNSLAATDVTAVHSGYARYRKRLLEAGIACSS